MNDATTSEALTDLGIRGGITASFADAGIINPFPIQALAIPLALSGTNLIGQARTDTGKMLTFGSSLLHRLQISADESEEPITHGRPQALVITPTRKLVLQVTRDLKLANSQLHTRVLTIYGGTGYDEQLSTLKKDVDVAVGTPGRLLDLANRRALGLSHIEVLMLDETDKVLDFGFLPDIEKLLAKAPPSRQSLLFSAAMPAPTLAPARATLNRPVSIHAEGADAQIAVPDITQFMYQAHDLGRPEVVARIAQARGTSKVMVFCRAKQTTQHLADRLRERGFPATAIHGDLNQIARKRSLKKFKAGAVIILVAIDITARGINIIGVNHVINYKCPDTDAAYVHHIGRTGRAGHTGVTVILVGQPDVTRWRVINKTFGLNFETPVETYSSSPHLYTSLGIPEGTRGRPPRSAHPPREVHFRRETISGGGTQRHRCQRSPAAPQGDYPSSTGGSEESTAPRRKRHRRCARVDVTESRRNTE